MFRNAYESLVLGEEDRYAGYKLLARQVWETYQSKIPKDGLARVGLRPLEDIDREILNRFLNPEQGTPFEVRAVLRTKLGLAPETAPPPVTTNAPPAKSSVE